MNWNEEITLECDRASVLWAPWANAQRHGIELCVYIHTHTHIYMQVASRWKAKVLRLKFKFHTRRVVYFRAIIGGEYFLMSGLACVPIHTHSYVLCVQIIIYRHIFLHVRLHLFIDYAAYNCFLCSCLCLSELPVFNFSCERVNILIA